MRINTVGIGLLAGLAMVGLSAFPAAAEDFTCHDKPGQVLYTYNGTPSQFHDRGYRRGASSYASTRYTTGSAHRRHYRAGARATYYRSRRYGYDR